MYLGIRSRGTGADRNGFRLRLTSAPRRGIRPSGEDHSCVWSAREACHHSDHGDPFRAAGERDRRLSFFAVHPTSAQTEVPMPIHSSSILRIAASAAFLSGVLSCRPDRIATPTGGPEFSRGGVPPSPGPATYEYHAGDAFLASLNPAFSPDVAMASNGDRIVLTGTGTLSVFPKSLTGG